MSAQNRPGILEAARLAGVSRWTIHRMVADGKLTAVHDRHGRRVIDLAELLRVFGDLHPEAVGAAHGAPPVAARPALVLLEVKLEAVERERDRLLADLERERQEKARLLGVVEAQQRLITHQQQTPAPPEAPAPERPPRTLRRSTRPRRSTPKKSAPTSSPTVAGEIAAALASWLRR